MKYLKKYKKFESIDIDKLADDLLNRFSKKDPKEVKSNIEDILIPLGDLNLRVIVRLEYDEYSLISIRIESEWADGRKYLFDWIDIEDDFLRIFDYIKGEYVPGKIYFKEVQQDGRIFNKNNKESLYLEDFMIHVNNSNKKLYSLSITLYEFVEYDKNWYKRYE